MRTYPLRVPRLFHKILPEAKFRLDEMEEDQYLLSFDDGPHPKSTPILLKLLNQLNLKVSFFLLGEQATKYPSLVAEIKSAGHRIGSHGFTHLNGWLAKDQVYIDDTKRACDLLETLDFRPPYGKISYKQYEKLQKLYQIILWSLMPGDFDQTVDSALLFSRLRKHVRKRDIIVLHDSPQAIVKLSQVLPALIEELSSKNLEHTFL
ncbi:MAG: peptidoglycan/xylan/chitin deacetylase (PgdA/CDA1 family) [Saprospiraceae bacterium]|jgi:peptidoglycan/xylan/chitin deacetylase (PgdA/CDA1 family)